MKSWKTIKYKKTIIKKETVQVLKTKSVPKWWFKILIDLFIVTEGRERLESIIKYEVRSVLDCFHSHREVIMENELDKMGYKVVGNLDIQIAIDGEFVPQQMPSECYSIVKK